MQGCYPCSGDGALPLIACATQGCNNLFHRSCAPDGDNRDVWFNACVPPTTDDDEADNNDEHVADEEANDAAELDDEAEAAANHAASLQALRAIPFIGQCTVGEAIDLLMAHDFCKTTFPPRVTALVKKLLVSIDVTFTAEQRAFLERLGDRKSVEALQETLANDATRQATQARFFQLQVAIAVDEYSTLPQTPRPTSKLFQAILQTPNDIDGFLLAQFDDVMPQQTYWRVSSYAFEVFRYSEARLDEFQTPKIFGCPADMSQYVCWGMPSSNSVLCVPYRSLLIPVLCMYGAWTGFLSSTRHLP
ncbi:hypothetical protein SPRG_15568 [Saprolegnia parasitica CBS 223.65]|uniref:Uncharacterized protein n=1 Tax=Saprolegnia parasitica (strain CBS 223.65) TaxID=695850 RepID=A0A067BKU6_SAPPC|nr:hypothetical protein SPRG_15568 [Saprolegnia parasitica CBS 223.65]KDO19089.1 hypothetical protein SPRG_15568 [Saprolegnia parasitica CBS 223.65]|eukprot:XP_012210192.1 hypothetical protein SPRG_15568 [Saprolegnia parasitica CBS 223.65]